MRHLGAPSLVISDGGNEFKGTFERGLEQLGCLQHVCAAESPWQNAKSERHGGWLKRRLVQEIESGRCTFGSLGELDEFLASLTAAKNRWFNHGGHSPTQLVFGELPRIPAELLNDHPGGLLPYLDALHDPAGMDEVGAEFRKRMKIRERARQAAMESDSKEAISKALKTKTGTLRRWNIGQWVYVFRRGKPGDSMHPTSRWVGPGLVVMNSQGIVWVAMRTRLWRCTAEQLRPAFPSEVLGSQLSSDPSLADLIRRVTSNTRAGAVDVTKEGPPPEERDQHQPTSRIEAEGAPPLEGSSHPEVLQQPTMSLPRGEVPRAPEPRVPVPPGLLSPGLPRQVSGEDAQTRTAGSRRSSLEEPAQEPEAPGALTPVPEEDGELRPDLAREDGPPNKVPRLEEGTRAPGTPLQPLLEIIRRGREEMATSSSDGVVGDRTTASEEARETSRSPRRTHEEQEHGLHSWFHFDDEGYLVLLAKRGDEVTMKELNEAERKLFEASDQVEWQAILQTKAVRVIVGKEADEIRKRWPNF